MEMATYNPQIIPLSKYYNIDPDIFEKLGILNIPLTADAPLFIDPQLLESSTYPMFSDTAWNKYKQFYVHLLRSINAIQNLTGNLKKRAENTVLRQLMSPEQKGLCLGYSAMNNKGRGIGKARAKQIFDSASEIISKGVSNPNLFSVVFLLENGIAGDCISDLTAKIILPELCEFTQTIAKQIGIGTVRYIVSGKVYELPRHPIEINCYLLFVPTDIINKLPTETNLHSVFSAFMSKFQHIAPQDSGTLRDSVSKQIADIWRDAMKDGASDGTIKRVLKRVVYNNPEAVNSVIDAVERTDLPPINFETDLASFNIIFNFFKYFDSNTISDIDKTNKLLVIDELIKRFCKFASDNTDFKRNLLYHNDNTPKNEHAWQQAFRCYIDDSLRTLDIDVTPEFPTGRGPVDFKFSDGGDFKILVEMKLSTNGQYLKGLTKQLEIYKDATNNVKKSYYLFIDFDNDEKGKKSKAQKLFDTKRESGLDTEIIIVDGTLPESASKA
jgi:hypothetical protein